VTLAPTGFAAPPQTPQQAWAVAFLELQQLMSEALKHSVLDADGRDVNLSDCGCWLTVRRGDSDQCA
jgi:hypothetical protein